MVNRVEKYFSLYWPIFLASFLYLQSSWQIGMFTDGYLYATFGKNALLKGTWLVPHLTDEWMSRFSDHTPFLFILEGIFFKIFGHSYVTVRIFTTLFTFSTLFLLIFWIKKFNKNWAIFTAIIYIFTYPLVRDSRFPNMDIPLMFFITLGLFFFWKTQDEPLKGLKYYLLTGLMFGGALLMKGVVAVFLPLTIFSFLIFSGKAKSLKSFWPWIGLLLGLGIFALWPLSLYLSDNFDIFLRWANFIFISSIKNGRGVANHSPFYTYVYILLKKIAPLLILFLLGVYKMLKSEKKNDLALLFSCLFFSVLIPLSFAKWKLAHYIIPLYPAVAVLGGYFCYDFFKKPDVIFKNIKYFLIFVAYMLLIFPLTNKNHYDKSIYRTKTLLKGITNKQIDWYVVDNSYGWHLDPLNVWDDNSVTFRISKDQFLGNLNKGKENRAFLLRKSLFDTHREAISKKFMALAHYEKSGLVVLIPEALKNKQIFFKYPL